ncbi:MAG: BRO family protein, partial [Cetobacterium sp.]
MNQLVQSTGGLWPLINLSGDYVTFDVGEKKKQKVKIVGTFKQPYFCGKDVCEILRYENVKQALLLNVKPKYKKTLKTLSEELGGLCDKPTFFGRNFQNLSYNDGKAVYVNEPGLYSLLSACKHPNSKHLKAFMDQFFYDLRYKSGIMDIFTFMKDKKVAIDVKSPWFQELWYPISKRTHSILTMRLFEWMGYGGEYFTQRQAFKKFLDNNNIPYEEITHTDPRFSEHPIMIKEIEQINPKVLHQKKWLVMEIRNFKKAVMRLNTKSGETVRDYYLNLEEACFEYAEYQSSWLIDKAEMERKISDEKLAKQMAMLSIKDKEIKKKDKDFEKKQKEEASFSIQMDMFDFIKSRNLPILKDINNQWFKQLWIPLTIKQTNLIKDQIQGGHQPTLEIVLTKDLFDFMGYEGPIKEQQRNFLKILNNSSIQYKEVEYSNTCTNEFIKAEAEKIAPQNLSRKRWIVMNIRSLKKAVMKLNTKNGEEIRDYYLNLEEFAFEYGQHVLERR